MTILHETSFYENTKKINWKMREETRKTLQYWIIMVEFHETFVVSSSK